MIPGQHTKREENPRGGEALDRERLDQMLLALEVARRIRSPAPAGFGVQRHLAAQRPDAPLDAHRTQPQQL